MPRDFTQRTVLYNIEEPLRGRGAARFTRILYATDGSPHAQKALDYVRELARIHHADVTIVHAYPEIAEQHRQPAAGVVSRAVSDLATTGIATTQELSEGDPRAANTHQCDLIVMGARGLSDLQGLAAGQRQP